MNVDNILKNYNVLLTGASGFVGMVILQRLLRVKNASNSQIFCTLRLSKYTSVAQRLRQEILNNEIMQLSEKEMEQIINNERIIAIQSDLTHDLLGFSEKMIKQLRKRQTVIIHCAADVIFNREFNESINVNVNGTYQLHRKSKQKHSFMYRHCMSMRERTHMLQSKKRFMIKI